MLFQKLVYRAGVLVLHAYTRWMLHRDIVRHADLPPGPKIYAVNHPSTTDPFYLLALVPDQVSILVSQIAFDAPLFGSYLRAAGHVQVDFENGRAAFNRAVDLLARGQSIGIFPEGALSPAEGGQHPARTGVARLALLSGAPVVPIGISLDWSRLRIVETTIKGTSDEARWYLNGPYSVTVGAPLTLDGDIDDWPYVQQAAQDIMQRVGELARESERRQGQQRLTTWYAVRTWLPLHVLNPIVG